MDKTFNSEITLNYFNDIVRCDWAFLEGIKVAVARIRDIPVLIPSNKYEELIEMGILERRFKYYILTESAYNWFVNYFNYDYETLKKDLNEFKEIHPDLFDKFKRYLPKAKIEFDYNDLWILDLCGLIVELKNGSFALNDHIVKIVFQELLTQQSTES